MMNEKELVMKQLNAFIAKANQWNAIFKGEQYEIQTSKGRQRLADKIDSDLSPENLTCDGELPRNVVQAKYKELTTVARQLKQLDPSVKFYEFE
jgi:hypothetical protein